MSREDQFERWDLSSYDAIHNESEAVFKALAQSHPPETLPERGLRNEFYQTRLDYMKEIGEARSFRDLARARQAVAAFSKWIIDFGQRVAEATKRSLCRHGHPRTTCLECAAEGDYLQAVREERR
jgi:hypothetical protein